MTIAISKETHKKLKSLCVEKDLKLQDLTEIVINAGIEQIKKNSKGV